MNDARREVEAAACAEGLDPLVFPFEGCQLIEASAGTGKTFTIAVLYVRAVLGHGIRPLMPRDILVTTFTELAADELKTRIQARLTQAARFFSGEAGEPDDSLARLRAAYPPDQHPLLADRLFAAADQMDDAAIHTIHGWCQRMLQEHAFLSGQPFSLTLQPDLSQWFDWAVQDYWRSHVYHLPEAAARAVAELLVSPAAVLDQLRTVIQQESDPIHAGETPPAFTESVAQLLASHEALQAAEGAAKACWQRDRVAVIAEFTAVAPQLNGKHHRGMAAAITEGQWQPVDDWAAGRPLPESWINLFCGTTLKGKLAPPDTAFQQALRAWRAQVSACSTVVHSLKTALLRQAAHWIRQRVAALKAPARMMGYNDLLLGLDRALDGEQGAVLAHTVAARYPLAMIDEFQDTDALQLSLFDRVFGITHQRAKPAAALVLIGDPKQSIYRFRHADIASYLSARRAARGIHTLKDNYRSTPSLVDAVNVLFEAAAAPGEGLFGGGGEILFTPATAKGCPPRLWRQHSDGAVAPAPLQIVAQRYASAADIGNKQEFLRAMAEATAAQIAEWLVAGNAGQAGWLAPTGDAFARFIEPQDIAILVADRFEAQAMRRALQKLGVASVFRSDRRHLFSTAQAKDFWHWLNAMAEPTRPDLLKIALATASCARRLDELDALRDDSIFSALVERFVGYRALWQRQGILAAVYQFLHDFEIPARLLQDESGDDGGARQLTNLLHLADWSQMEQQRRPGVEALRQRVALALTTGEAEGELRLDQDEHLVQILTIHASKGLQFPLVYLPFLALLGSKETKQKGALRVAEHGWLFDPDDAARAAEKAALLDESVRLAYVALTRAESACVVGVGLVKTGNAKALSSADTAFGRLWGWVNGDPAEDPLVLGRYGEALARLSSHEGIAIEWLRPPEAVSYQPSLRAAPLMPARTAGLRASRGWRMSSYSQIVDDAGQVAPERAREAILQESDAAWPELPIPAAARMSPIDAALAAALATLPRGSVFGSLMHEVLEAAGRAGFAAAAEDGACAALIESHLPTTGELAAHPALWRRWLDALLTCPLAIEPPNSLQGLTKYRLELEFWLPVAQLNIAWFDAELMAAVFPGRPRPALTTEQLQGVIKGFIDLVFEADGRYFVLDYKSNALPDYAPDELIDAMLAHRYDVQLVIYLAAVHRHLMDRLADYDPARHLGGAVYWFTRGVAHPGAGQCVVAPPLALLRALDACWDGVLAEEAV